MALDAAQTAQIFEIFKIPQGGAGFSVDALTTLFGAFGEAYDFASVVTALNAKIVAVTAYQETRIETHLDNWDVIGGTDPLTVTKSATGTEGNLVNYPEQRENIRQAIADILGFICPGGGFSRELRRQPDFGVSR